MISKDWIEVNLPFEYSLTEKESAQFIAPPYPDLSNKEEKEFGISIEESRKFISDEEFDEYNKEFDRLEMDKLGRNDIIKKLSDLNNKSILKVLEHNILAKKIDDWYPLQPEIIEWHKQCDEIDKKRYEYLKDKRFVARPGILIEVEIDGVLEQFLIGHINPILGVCDDCTMFTRKTIVKRYKIAWEPEKSHVY